MMSYLNIIYRDFLKRFHTLKYEFHLNKLRFHFSNHLYNDLLKRMYYNVSTSLVSF